MGCEIESNDRRVPNAVDITAAEIPLAYTQEWSPQVPKKIYVTVHGKRAHSPQIMIFSYA